MHMPHAGAHRPRTFVLAATLAAAGLAGHATTARAADIPVTNCNDSGAGSLRAAVAIAGDGDVIDMRALRCWRIDLTSGHITVPQPHLSIAGPGAGRLTIDAGQHSGIFRHTGLGFAVNDVTLQKGFYASGTAAFGGCIYSTGIVAVNRSRVRWCVVRSTGSARAFGAGIYATRVELFRTEVTGNTGIDAGAFAQPEGGGVYVLGRLNAEQSRISGNHARRAGGAWVGNGLLVRDTTISNNDGGALEASGEAVIYRSTISGNKNAWWIVTLDGIFDDVPLSIFESTISGNSSVYDTVNLSRGVRTIFNSTVAYNRHAGGCLNSTVFTGSGETHVESSIFAKNTCAGAPYRDIGGFGDPGDVLVGAHNLIMSTNLPAPLDTLTGDPLLAPLADNGGRTMTHALRTGSPAIGAGSNAGGFPYDQRGPGFPRTIGTTDIGAFER